MPPKRPRNPVTKTPEKSDTTAGTEKHANTRGSVWDVFKIEYHSKVVKVGMAKFDGMTMADLQFLQVAELKDQMRRRRTNRKLTTRHKEHLDKQISASLNRLRLITLSIGGVGSVDDLPISLPDFLRERIAESQPDHDFDLIGQTAASINTEQIALIDRLESEDDLH